MANSRSNLIKRYVSSDLFFRVAVVDATDVVREMQSIQKTYPLATMAVGRAMVAASLMASQLKPENMVSLYFRGDGPLEMFFAEASYEGDVRGYSPHPQLELNKNLSPTLVGLALGQGTLTVVRTTPFQKQPDRGTVELQTGDVAEDVAYYLLQSTQTRSALSLGLKMNTFGQVEAAGGILIELMPGAPEELIAKIEANFKAQKSLSETLAQGAQADDIKNQYLNGFNLVDLDHPFRLSYRCRCSRERLANAMTLLGVTEVETMLAQKQPAHAKCEFCGRDYVIELPELQMLLEKMKTGPAH